MATEKFEKETMSSDRNPDPITGAPGAHPVGTGVGAAGGGTAGAAIGAIGGPAGAVIGAVVARWPAVWPVKVPPRPSIRPPRTRNLRTNYASRPYYESTFSYDEDYRPAYQYGWFTGASKPRRALRRRRDAYGPRMG